MRFRTEFAPPAMRTLHTLRPDRLDAVREAPYPEGKLLSVLSLLFLHLQFSLEIHIFVHREQVYTAAEASEQSCSVNSERLFWYCPSSGNLALVAWDGAKMDDQNMKDVRLLWKHVITCPTK